MTVKQLKRMLEDVNDDAIVYIGNPNHFKDLQTAHEEVGARYIVSSNEEIWFETYSGENIAEEVYAISQIADEENWDEWDFYDELFNKHQHGYTIEDIKKNCNPDIYEAYKTYLETHAI